MSIDEQVKELRKTSDGIDTYSDMSEYSGLAISIMLDEAADTIESLSAKLQAANMERSADCKMIDGKKLLEDLEKEVFTADLYEHGWDGQTVDNLLCLGDVKKVIDGYRWSADCGGWIPCNERLPEENEFVLVAVQLNEMSFKEYETCCGYLMNGKWYTYTERDFFEVGEIHRTDKVIAWQPLPEPYHEP